MNVKRRRGVFGALKRLFSSAEQLDDERLAQQVTEAGAEPLCDCAARARVVVRGTIASITINKQGGSGWLEAEVNDGTGTATLVWMGRRTIPGIVAGRAIKVAGRLSRRGDDMVIYNPEYELLS